MAVTLSDLITRMPAANAQIKLCRKIDVTCANPVATAVSDGNGGATFSVDMVDFAGYLTIQADGMVPTLYFFNPAIDRDQAVAVSLASPAANAGLLLQLGRQPSPGHGNVVILSADCTGTPAAGVSYATSSGDGMTSPFYTVMMLPNATATATDSDGYGGLVNVPEGGATISATLANPHAELGTISLLVQEGAITYSRVVPIAH